MYLTISNLLNYLSGLIERLESYFNYFEGRQWLKEYCLNLIDMIQRYFSLKSFVDVADGYFYPYSVATSIVKRFLRCLYLVDKGGVDLHYFKDCVIEIIKEEIPDKAEEEIELFKEVIDKEIVEIEKAIEKYERQKFDY